MLDMAPYRQNNYALVKEEKTLAPVFKLFSNCIQFYLKLLPYLYKSGDSGGPIMIEHNIDPMHVYYYLTGIVAFGPVPCGRTGWPAVYIVCFILSLYSCLQAVS